MLNFSMTLSPKGQKLLKTQSNWTLTLMTMTSCHFEGVVLVRRAQAQAQDPHQMNPQPGLSQPQGGQPSQRMI